MHCLIEKKNFKKMLISVKKTLFHSPQHDPYMGQSIQEWAE